MVAKQIQLSLFISVLLIASLSAVISCGPVKKTEPTAQKTPAPTSPQTPIVPDIPEPSTGPHNNPPTPPGEPNNREQVVQGCPASPNLAITVGSYFENQLVDGNLVIKPWGGHSHEFSEVKALGWSDDDLKLAATLSQHVDLTGKYIRFADNDIAAFLGNAKLCPLTIKFLLSYLAPKEQNIFLSKLSAGQPNTPNSSKALDVIIAHLNKRFKDLETILDKAPKYHVKFPGQSAQKHRLGTGLAEANWSDKNDHKAMLKHISTLIEALAQKYPGRVHFGYIGDFKLDSNTGDCDRSLRNPQGIAGPQSNGTFMIHVWGANDGNFNLPNDRQGSFGSGQASCFEKQRPGVFGISTLPGDAKLLMEADKLIGLYQ